MASVKLPIASATLDLGGPVSLRTSGGLTVMLPPSGRERLSLLPLLEQWSVDLLAERYQCSTRAPRDRLLAAYYRLKRFLPRAVQLALRRAYAGRQRAAAVLKWPMDGTWVALSEAYLAIRLDANGGVGMDVARTWPQPYQAAAVLSHDVEGAVGQDRCLLLASVEEEAGFRSCFNFVAERYPVNLPLLARLRESGHEIGLHGIKHDGLKFSSRSIFERRIEQLRHYRSEWKVDGFRSPATHRNWEWMPDLPFDYDSSYPDTDPFEPMSGGCSCPYPFFIGSLVELPITLAQDHTLWEILDGAALPIWRAKAQWVWRCSGLINIIVHPDYITNNGRLQEYRDFLTCLRALPKLWCALPGEVATWWRTRGTATRRVALISDGARWSLAFQ